MSGYDPQSGRDMPEGPELSSAQSAAQDEDLQGGLTGLAGMVSAAYGVDSVLAEVAGFAAQAIPGADGAGITLLRPEDLSPRIHTWGVGEEFVVEVDRIQYEMVNEGPCITCMQTGRPVVSGALGSDGRWPRFGGRVARLGIHSALSLPLVVDDVVVGAINAYARERDSFTEHAVRLGELFAGPAAVAVHNAHLLEAARARAEQLQAALASRAVIDQAIGILRSRVGGSSDEAFARLRRISQAENIKLAVVAQQLVDEAVRRAQARHTKG